MYVRMTLGEGKQSRKPSAFSSQITLNACLSIGQLTLLGNAAINACDVVNGQHLGYIPDPSECRYDPAHDDD